MSDTLDPKFVNYLQTLPYVQAHYRKSEYARIAGLPQVQEKLDLLQKTGKLTRRDGKPATTPEEIAWARDNLIRSKSMQTANDKVSEEVQKRKTDLGIKSPLTPETLKASLANMYSVGSPGEKEAEAATASGFDPKDAYDQTSAQMAKDKFDQMSAYVPFEQPQVVNMEPETVTAPRQVQARPVVQLPRVAAPQLQQSSTALQQQQPPPPAGVMMNNQPPPQVSPLAPMPPPQLAYGSTDPNAPNMAAIARYKAAQAGAN